MFRHLSFACFNPSLFFSFYFCFLPLPAQPGSSTSARKLSALAAALPRENDGTSGGGDEKWQASLRALTRYHCVHLVRIVPFLKFEVEAVSMNILPFILRLIRLP